MFSSVMVTHSVAFRPENLDRFSFEEWNVHYLQALERTRPAHR